jgi:chorismate mutase / prephenate dehydrogenase
MSLDDLRRKLDDIDRRVIDLVAARQELVRAVGEEKRALGVGTRDFQRERHVILGAREHATRLGVSPELAEAVLELLIRESLATQEQARVVASNRGGGRSALVIGGAGRMGRWLSTFLASQGFRVLVADPAGPVEAFEHVADWRALSLDHDLIAVAAPIQRSNEILLALAERRPRGVVFDIGSLKTPLRAGLDALAGAGCAVTSIHPMFGPSTELLSGRHVLFIDLGSTLALREARALFDSTMAQQVVMDLDEHDRLVAYVLGLSHALNIAFFTALAESGEAAPRLASMSSTTYDAQAEIAAKVAQESAELYFEIQSLNAYGREPLDALRDAVERLASTVQRGDLDGFRSLMRRGREYLSGRAKER